MDIKKGDVVRYIGHASGQAISNIGTVRKISHIRFLDVRRWNLVSVDWGRRWKLDEFLPEELEVIRRRER